ncbi:MAG: hypothetical protein FJ161_01615 [Gammaproteobacteria bacterium]|nr:hypothetical protein [Gammaproteobacteria bacterium]
MDSDYTKLNQLIMDIQSSDYIDPENLLWRNPESLILSQSLQNPTQNVTANLFNMLLKQYPMMTEEQRRHQLPLTLRLIANQLFSAHKNVQGAHELLLQALSTRFKIALDVLQRIENGISEDMLGTHKNILKKSRK